MKRHESVTKIMSTKLVTAHHGDPVSKVRRLLAENGVHHIPVVSGEKLMGVISSSDLHRLNFGDALHVDQRSVDATLDHTFTIEQVMRTDPVTVEPETTIREAAGILAKGEFHSLPVVRGGALVGMLTSTDLIRYLHDQF